MRPTKSKEQLAYYKHLLAIDKKRNELSNRKDSEDNYILKNKYAMKQMQMANLQGTGYNNSMKPPCMPCCEGW